MSSQPEIQTRKTKILIVTRNLPPLVGGMERLNWHMVDELSKYADIRLVGPNEAATLRPQQIEFHGVPLKPLWRFLLSAGWQTFRQARSWKPDIILAGSGLTAPIAFIAARHCGAQAGAYTHGLDIAVTHPLYRTLWIPAIRRLDRLIANSTPTAELAKQAGVSADKIRIVHPGVSLPEHPQPQEHINLFLEANKLAGKTVLLSVGRLTSRKGLREFVQHSLPAIVADKPDAMLVVIGDIPNNSLRAEVQTRQSIQTAADTAGVGQHLRFLGVITDAAKLACAYECAALHIFPVRSLRGDPEGFGMVAIEAAAHGTPSVAFATGGVIDAVAEGKSGRLAPPDNYFALTQAILQTLNDPPALWHANTRKFAKSFAWPAFGQRMLAALKPDDL